MQRVLRDGGVKQMPVYRTQNPCVPQSSNIFVWVFQDFYNYACGGYNEKAYLSWFSTRIRENPEEIIQHYRRYAIGE